MEDHAPAGLSSLARPGVLADAEEAPLRCVRRGLRGAQGDAPLRPLSSCSNPRGRRVLDSVHAQSKRGGSRMSWAAKMEPWANTLEDYVQKGAPYDPNAYDEYLHTRPVHAVDPPTAVDPPPAHVPARTDTYPVHFTRNVHLVDCEGLRVDPGQGRPRCGGDAQRAVAGSLSGLQCGEECRDPDVVQDGTEGGHVDVYAEADTSCSPARGSGGPRAHAPSAPDQPRGSGLAHAPPPPGQAGGSG